MVAKRRDNEPVEMPAKTTLKNGPSGTKYVYLTLRAYRNAKGKPTSDEASIGKLAPDGVSLIPNMRYFEFFPEKASPGSSSPLVCSKTFGSSATLDLLADKLGIRQMLSSCMGSLSRPVLLAASYMVEQGNVMCHIENYCEQNWTPDGVYLDSRSTSDLFNCLSIDYRSDFLSSWIAKRAEQEYIAYDVTSFSTYAGGIEDAEWGYNRDGDDLMQINLGMFIGQESHLPVYYQTYQGSVLDKSHLVHMMESAKALGIEKLRFAFDRGFVSEDNLNYVMDEHLSFISALPASFKVYKALIAQASPDISSSRNAITGQGIYALMQHAHIGGHDLLAHVYFSPLKKAADEAVLYARIDKQEAELSQICASTALPRKYKELFKVQGEKAGLTCFCKDYDKIDARLCTTGYFVLLTNDERLSSKDVLLTYRGKDTIEKAFAAMKNQLDFKRMRTHGTSTTDGKLFCGFIALILRSYMRVSLSRNPKTEKLSVNAALRELSKLKRVSYRSGELQHTAITKTQREILEALDIEVKELLEH